MFAVWLAIASLTRQPSRIWPVNASMALAAKHAMGWRNWVKPHTAASSWDQVPAVEKVRLGMTAVKDSAAMAQACAGCHVGRLLMRMALCRFATSITTCWLQAIHDLTSNLPPSWPTFLPIGNRLPGAPMRCCPASAKPWAVGQVESARAALGLLADRVTRAANGASTGTWPEFAEYACSSCHHDLTSSSVRLRQPNTTGSPGRISWGSWFLSVPEQILANDAAEVSSLAALRKHLERPYPSLPATAKLVDGAATALARMEGRLMALPDEKLASQSLEKLRSLKSPANLCCWDSAEQRSLSRLFWKEPVLQNGIPKWLERGTITCLLPLKKRFLEGWHSRKA